ncbi:MAG: potassium channel protein, partial [Calditrichae bacterium]|nr:potassium channel protein [Calditrichia bacterium]NIW79638.1 potassium channel protein [Calditrichia bacterium]
MVNSDSPLNNQSLGESAFRQNLNIIIVAIYRADGQFIYNPTSSATIQKGDRLIAIGQSEDLIKLTQLCGQKEIVS